MHVQHLMDSRRVTELSIIVRIIQLKDIYNLKIDQLLVLWLTDKKGPQIKKIPKKKYKKKNTCTSIISASMCFTSFKYATSDYDHLCRPVKFHIFQRAWKNRIKVLTFPFLDNTGRYVCIILPLNYVLLECCHYQYDCLASVKVQLKINTKK